ncbi:prolyl-tRNA synthetase associated domain-containing protein [Bacillus sp. JJ722]|uniref:prolyl-tRNA synthetase associated domain-containing protein n=1 Tax=Bacillus sp. JJ722 TaxID=3122973 RepID=UPI002FFF9587
MGQATEKEAYEILEKLNISFQRIDHEAITSVKHYDAELPGPQVKNLLLTTKKEKQYYFIIVPDEIIVDLKALASELQSRRLSFASPEELDQLIGLKPGTLTPIALHHDVEQKIQVVIDSSIDQQDTVGIHPNVNTTTAIIAFHDLERILSWSSHPPKFIKL